MNPSYRRDKDHNYMVLDAPQALQGTEYQIRMLVGNQIPHLLKCHMRMMDGKPVFFYEITGMQPLFRIFEKAAMNEEDIRNILDGVKAALENAERFLLDGNQLLFEPEYMFLDIQTREVHMCCLPSYPGSMAENFRRLAEYILKKLNHSEEQAVMLGYDVYSRTAEENYCLSEVLQLIYQSRRKEEKHAAELLKRTEQKIYEENGDTEKAGFEEEIFEREEVYLEENGVSGRSRYPEENDLSGKGRYPEGNDLSGKGRYSEGNDLSGKSRYPEGNDLSEKSGYPEENYCERKNVHERGKFYGEKQPFIKKGCGRKKRILFAAGCLGVTCIAAALVLSGFLDYAQAGGILFVIAGIGIYFISSGQKDGTDEKTESENENDWKTEKRQGLKKDKGNSRKNSKKGNGKNRKSREIRCREGRTDFVEKNETCVLWQKKERDIAVLESIKPERYDNIVLYKDEIHIGKEEWKADICIPCNVVSRVHARVIRREGFYYLTDLDSTNGTFINGKRIAPAEAMLLEQGDRVKFADVEYIFQMQT